MYIFKVIYINWQLCICPGAEVTHAVRGFKRLTVLRLRLGLWGAHPAQTISVMPDFFRRAHHFVVEGGKYIAVGRDKVLRQQSPEKTLIAPLNSRSKIRSILQSILGRKVPHYILISSTTKISPSHIPSCTTSQFPASIGLSLVLQSYMSRFDSPGFAIRQLQRLHHQPPQYSMGAMSLWTALCNRS